MRLSFPSLSGICLLACAVAIGPGQPLDGAWALESSARSPLDPRTLTLSQHGDSLVGSGRAMGVDVPLPVTVTGVRTATGTVLTFAFENGSGVTATYTATLQTDGRLVGSAVFNGISSDRAYTDTLTYIRR